MLDLISQALFEPRKVPLKRRTALPSLILPAVIFALFLNLAFTRTVFPLALLLFFGLFILYWFALGILTWIFRRGLPFAQVLRAATLGCWTVIPWAVLIMPYLAVHFSDLYTGGIFYPLLVYSISHYWFLYIVSSALSRTGREFRQTFKAGLLATVLLVAVLLLIITVGSWGEITPLRLLELF